MTGRSDTELAGRYRLERPLGEGGSGRAWAAVDLATGRAVAVKVAPVGGGEAMRRELDHLRGLRHPRLVEVLALGRSADGRAFLVTELVDGDPLDAWSPGRSAAEIRAAVADAVEGLVFLHDLGLVHGDVKPANVLVDRRGRATLIDLGCASAIGATPDALWGTPRFLAPERLDGGPPDVAADVYAIGATLASLPELDAETRALAEAATGPRAGRPPDARAVLERLGRAAPSMVTPLGRAPALFDRDALLARFDALLDGVERGEPGGRALWIDGRDGAGRTRALRELAWRAQARCRVREAWPSSERPVSALLARAADAAPPVGFEDAVALAGRLATGEPTVLIVDDVHALPAFERVVLEAVLRTLPRDGRVAVALASRPGADVVGAERATLEPLSDAALGRWCEGWVSEGALGAVAEATGRLPGDVERLLAALALGSVSEADVRALGWAGPRAVPPIDGAEREAAALVATSGRLDDGRVRAWGLDAERLLELQRARIVRRDAAGWSLARSADRLALRAVADREALARFHADLAEEASGPRRALHLAAAGEVVAARALIADADPDRDPEAWVEAIEALGDAVSGDARAAHVAARLMAAAGRLDRALSLHASVLRRRPDPTRAAATRVDAARVRLRMGRPAAARRALERVLAGGPASARPEALAVMARVLVELGEFGAAEARAGEGLALVGPGATRRELLLARGIARTYLGDAFGAAEALDEAWRAADGAAPRERVLLCSYRAIADFRRGALVEARRDHEEALALVERHGLSDQIATVVLNLGTAQQQLGDWGAALASFERAQRASRALGRASTEVLAEHNLANLCCVIGDAVRARRHLEAAAAGCEAADLSHLGPSIEMLRGEIALLEGRVDDARAALEAVRVAKERGSREAAERALHLARVEREAGRADHARAWREEASERLAAEPATDLEARLALERGRAALDAGRSAEAIGALEAAREGARGAGELHLEGEAEAALARAARAAGASALQAAAAARAGAIFERIAVTLPEGHRAVFMARPERAVAEAATPPAPRPRIERLLEINKRLNSDLSAERVLEHAIDAAIELTGAERGFVLIREGDALRVATARNLDRERVGRSHLKFSRTVAEEVLDSGAPLLTTDARRDARFRDHESVHAMRLTSIACAPIESPGGVLGAIYLDNRFERGRFTEADIGLLCACADQVALALSNARRIDELRRRTEELERQQALVRELLAEREARIEVLERDARDRSVPAPATRDYPSIVGRGRAMRAMLAVLDRVVDSDLSVVIEGESGTGKELVARAIHDHGSRRDGPLLAVNCAALPETLLEGELFGWRRGAFTGADRDRDGIFVRAEGGTVFLDEVGEMPASMQVKLLRVLQQREVQPLGGADPVTVDVRVVAATNRRMPEEVEAGRFREDLYYRLAVVPIGVPPLRQRREDLPALVRHLLTRSAQAMGGPVPRVHPDAMRRLTEHPWPGNVRELENVLSRALVMGDGALVRVEDLGLRDARRAPRSRSEMQSDEARRIAEALADTGWNVSEVSRRLGIPRTTLYRKLSRYGLQPEP